MHKIWTGGHDNVARCNGVPIKARKCTNLNKAWFSYTAPMVFTSQQLEKVKKIEDKVQVTIYGNDAISYALVAEGKLDLVIEDKLKPWDFSALVPVMQAAGCYVTDLNGQPINLLSDGSFIGAATKELHERAFKIMQD